MTTTDISNFISCHEWTFAKTMADIPHWYIVRDKLTPEDKKFFDDLVAFIQKNGYMEKFFGKDYLYFNVGEYKYWFDCVVLNRAELNPKK